VALLIDTSVLVELERAHAALPTKLEDEGAFLSAISASELLHGVERAPTAAGRARREAFVERALDLVSVLPFDLDAARVHARIWADLTRRGAMIGAHDLIIAATAICHDLTVVTRNHREFSRVDGLAVRGRE
jgi:predicted nucleic acid-binding protein